MLEIIGRDWHWRGVSCWGIHTFLSHRNDTFIPYMMGLVSYLGYHLGTSIPQILQLETKASSESIADSVGIVRKILLRCFVALAHVIPGMKVDEDITKPIKPSSPVEIRCHLHLPGQMLYSCLPKPWIPLASMRRWKGKDRCWKNQEKWWPTKKTLPVL